MVMHMHAFVPEMAVPARAASYLDVDWAVLSLLRWVLVGVE